MRGIYTVLPSSHSPQEFSSTPTPPKSIFFSIFRCLRGETIMLATRVPLAATAGTPMPGHTESPVHTRPGKGVLGPAKVSRPMIYSRSERGSTGGGAVRHAKFTGLSMQQRYQREHKGPVGSIYVDRRCESKPCFAGTPRRARRENPSCPTQLRWTSR